MGHRQCFVFDGEKPNIIIRVSRQTPERASVSCTRIDFGWQ